MLKNRMEVQVVLNNDRLRRKLGVTPGKPLAVDPALLAEAEKAIADMESSYRDWVSKDIDALAETIGRIAADPQNAAADIRMARKQLHDIRGQGGTFGFDLITAIADSLHDLVKISETPEPRIVELMRVHIDALKLVQSKELKGDGGEEGTAMRQMLALAVAKLR